MASASISEIKSYFMGNVNNNTTKDKESTGIGDSFSAVFDKTQDSRSGSETNYAKTNQKGNDSSIQNHANIQKKNIADKVKMKEDTAKQLQDEKRVEEAMEEAGADMVSKVADTFDVSEEEVEQILEVLGLTALDLLSKENLTQVVMALNPGTDILTIMTDEQLFADLKNLMNSAEDMLNQMSQNYQMSQEEMMSLLASMQEESQDVLSMSDIILEDTGNVTDAQTTELMGERIDVIDKRQERNADSQDHSNGSAGQSFVQNMLNQLTEAVDKSMAAQSIYGTSGQEIINQITEYIKVNIKPDTTEMELQLQPASLGNIKIQLASTEGMLTATFTTENEAVKAVLETQIIQLKENFEQQGLKVDAVEVNVSAQAFERNLDQQEQGQQQQEAKAQKQRRIRLNGFENANEDILLEDVLEEDKVVADMMLRNGNSVDYTV